MAIVQLCLLAMDDLTNINRTVGQIPWEVGCEGDPFGLDQHGSILKDLMSEDRVGESLLDPPSVPLQFDHCDLPAADLFGTDPGRSGWPWGWPPP